MARVGFRKRQKLSCIQATSLRNLFQTIGRQCMAGLRRATLLIKIALAGSTFCAVAATAQDAGSASTIRARSHWMVHARIPERAPAKVTAKDNYRPPSAILYPASAYAIDVPLAVSGVAIDTTDARTLIGLEADQPIGCFQRRGSKNFGQLMSGTFPLARLCLLDLDRNSAFDHYSVIQSEAEDVIQFEGVLSDIQPLDQPIVYRSIDPQSVEDLAKLSLPLPYYASLVKRVPFRFGVSKRANANPNVVQFLTSLPFSVGKAHVLFLGTPYVISREDKGDFLVGVTGESKPATVFLGTQSCCWQSLKFEQP